MCILHPRAAQPAEADYVLDQRVDIHGVHPVCSDSSPELIPAAEGMCSAFCLEEDAETAAAAAKVPHLSRLLVPLYHRLTAAGSALQGPKTPRQQAGALLRFCTSTPSSRLRHRHGGHMPAHSDALCPCLGPRQLSPALGSTCCTLSHTLRFVSITAHSRRGGHVSHTASFVTIVAALQLITCCDALLPAPGGHDVRWEAGASSLLHHTDDASGSCSGGSDCLDRRSNANR